MSHGRLRHALGGSLRMRLLAGTLFWIIVSIIAAGWGLGGLFRQHVSMQFHAELITHLDQLTANLALDAQSNPVLTIPLSDPRLTRPYSGYYWQVDAIRTAGDGTGVGAGAPTAGLMRSRSLWDYVLVTLPDALIDGQIHQHRIKGPDGKMLGMVERSVHMDDAPDGKPRAFRLIAAANETLMDEPVARFTGVLWLALGLLGLGLVVAALVQVLVGLAPLGKLRVALGRVRSGETQQLEGEFPGEIQPLVEDFNTVIAQNAEVVERARTQAGNLAHALKTPLTVLANAAEATKHRDDALAHLVIDQVNTARRQVDYHLARAQAAASTRMPGVRTPLLPVIEGLVRTMQRIHTERGLTINIGQIPVSLAFRGDAQDLQEMLGNLIDNACKWAEHHIEVNATMQGNFVNITIDDDGQGVANEQRHDVLRRGVRADEKVPGSGLGLAIVGDLAQLYGGTLVLQESPLGGLRAVLTLPGQHHLLATQSA